MTLRFFWPGWLLASVTTGLVAGFMLGHALILGRFLDWILTTDPRLLATTYPTFARSAGSTGLTMFYAICGLQIVTALALLALALGVRRHRTGAALAGLTAILWPILHYASGIGAVEAVALRNATPITPEVGASFVAWNAPLHTIHAALLTVGLIALLAMPLTAARPRPVDEVAHVLVLPATAPLIHGVGERNARIWVGKPQRPAGAEVPKGARAGPSGRSGIVSWNPSPKRVGRCSTRSSPTPRLGRARDRLRGKDVNAV